MEIAVDGWRPDKADWEVARGFAAEQLVPLTPQQREVARKLGVPEVDYARRILAGERSQENLLTKTRRLARLLKGMIPSNGAHGKLRRVTMRTIQGRFDVEVEVGGDDLLLKIDEAIVDDYFDKGSEAAAEKLARIVDRAFAVRV